MTNESELWSLTFTVGQLAKLTALFRDTSPSVTAEYQLEVDFCPCVVSTKTSFVLNQLVPRSTGYYS